MCGDGNEGESVGTQKQLESVYPITASIIGAGSTKSIKALNWRMQGETGILYQHDPRHGDVLNGSTVQTPVVDDVEDENPVWLDPEQISKHRSHVARCLLLSQDRADMTFAVNDLCRRMSDLPQHSFTKLKRVFWYLKLLVCGSCGLKGLGVGTGWGFQPFRCWPARSNIFVLLFSRVA